MSKPARDSFSANFSLMNSPEPEPSQAWSAAALANMDMLDDVDLPACILQATIRGRERTVRTIMERRGPVPIVLEVNPLDALDQKLNGVPIEVDTEYKLFDVQSAAGLKSLLAMIAEFGMKGLVDAHTAYPLLLSNPGLNKRLMRRIDSSFSGVLPELSEGLMRQPELAIALDAESASTSTPDAYKPILCWASDDMLEKFPGHLHPLVHVQAVEGVGTMKQWKEASGQPGNMDFTKIEVGVEATPACSNVAQYVQWVMTPELSRYGFEDERGRHLCETTTDFLLQFPTTECDEQNLKAAFSFTANYCPINIMSAQAVTLCREKFGIEEERYGLFPDMIETMESGFGFLFSALRRDHPLQSRVKDLMTKDQWKSLFHRANYLDAPSLLGLYDAFKINNAGRGISLFREDLEVLAETGYRFAGNTKIFSLADDHLFDAWNKTENLQIRPSVCLTFFSPAFISSTGASADAQKAFRSLLKVNLWPNHGTPPKNVASALNRASMCSLKTLRNSTTLALHSYLFNAGVEACAEAATSPDHWNTLLSVFTGDELQPYLAEMPREARGRVLEDGLGL